MCSRSAPSSGRQRVVQRESSSAGDDVGGRRCVGAVVGHAADRVLDRAVAGAAADVALERTWQVLALFFGQRSCRHHEAGRTESALEALGVGEGPLDRMQIASRCGQAVDRGHGSAAGAGGRVQAAVDRAAVDVDRAGAAVTGVAALLDARASVFAQQRAQALSRRGLSLDRCAR